MADIKRLTRSKNNKILAGVCAGLGEYLEVDPLVFRIAFIILGIFGGGGIIAYMIFWLFVPYEGHEREVTQEDILKENAEDIKEQFTKLSERVERSNKAYLPGLILLTIGILIALTNMHFIGPGLILPGVFIVTGLYLIFK